MSVHVHLRRLFDAIGPPDALASAKLMENKSVVRTSSTLPARARQGLIRTILVPVDFSDCSLAGLTYAIRFPTEVGARICSAEAHSSLRLGPSVGAGRSHAALHHRTILLSQSFG